MFPFIGGVVEGTEVVPGTDVEGGFDDVVWGAVDDVVMDEVVDGVVDVEVVVLGCEQDATSITNNTIIIVAVRIFELASMPVISISFVMADEFKN